MSGDELRALSLDELRELVGDARVVTVNARAVQEVAIQQLHQVLELKRCWDERNEQLTEMIDSTHRALSIIKILSAAYLRCINAVDPAALTQRQRRLIDEAREAMTRAQATIDQVRAWQRD
jgi:hypothetical protein